MKDELVSWWAFLVCEQNPKNCVQAWFGVRTAYTKALECTRKNVYANECMS